MKKAIMLTLLLGLTACNTIDGFGRDISASAQRVGSWFR